MDAQAALRLTLDPAEVLRAQGITPDPWQQEFLLRPEREVMLNCSRGADKSSVVSALADHHAVTVPGSLTLIVSRAERQAKEVHRYCRQGMEALGWPVPVGPTDNKQEIELRNGSRIVAVPGTEVTIRSYQGVTLIIIDEAARVPLDLYGAVSGMTKVRQGRTVTLSTPFGQQGWWWREWCDERNKAARFKVPWQRCPRIRAEDVEEDRRKFGDAEGGEGGRSDTWGGGAREEERHFTQPSMKPGFAKSFSVDSCLALASLLFLATGQ